MASDTTCASRSRSVSRSVSPSPPSSPIANTPDPELQFILKLKTLPVLWDKDHQDYSNRYKRLDAQKKLLPILRQRNSLATIVHVRKKLNILRTNYRRERKREIRNKRDSIESSQKYPPHGRFYNHLHFLYKNDDDMMDESSEAQYLEDTTEFDEWTKPQASSTSIIVKDEPKSGDKEQFIKEYETFDPISTSTEPTRISTTALYWTEKLDRLSHTQRIYAEKAINEILLEAELENLDKNSVKIN